MDVTNWIESPDINSPGCEKEFIDYTAKNLRGRSIGFGIEQSNDFQAILYSTGQATGTDVTVPHPNRARLIEDIKSVDKFTVHTGRRALFYRSFTFDMVSGDRNVFIQRPGSVDEENPFGVWFCPDYLDPRQVTVLASYFSQRCLYLSISS